MYIKEKIFLEMRFQESNGKNLVYEFEWEEVRGKVL